jgi:hypothetical protein
MDLYDNVALFFSDLGKIVPCEISHNGDKVS